jgi:hypothetical protein
LLATQRHASHAAAGETVDSGSDSLNTAVLLNSLQGSFIGYLVADDGSCFRLLAGTAWPATSPLESQATFHLHGNILRVNRIRSVVRNVVC